MGLEKFRATPTFLLDDKIFDPLIRTVIDLVKYFTSQSAFTCSASTIKTLEQCVKSVQILQ